MTESEESAKPMVSPGSMLNSSEGLLSTGALAALVQQMTTNSDWRVQAACAVSIAALASTYVVMRQKSKVVGE